MTLQAKLGLLVAVAVAVSFGGAGCTSTPVDAPCDGGCATSAPHPAPCAAGEFHYADQACSNVPGDGGSPCDPMGDGRCYQTCTTSADCSSGYDCTLIGLYHGTDTCCDQTVHVCTNSAPHPAPCAANEYRYVDTSCQSLPGDGGTSCTDMGDGLCYHGCRTTPDCSSGYYCKSIGLYVGGATCCAETANVCVRCQGLSCY